MAKPWQSHVKLSHIFCLTTHPQGCVRERVFACVSGCARARACVLPCRVMLGHDKSKHKMASVWRYTGWDCTLTAGEKWMQRAHVERCGPAKWNREYNEGRPWPRPSQLGVGLPQTATCHYPWSPRRLLCVRHGRQRAPSLASKQRLALAPPSPTAPQRMHLCLWAAAWLLLLELYISHIALPDPHPAIALCCLRRRLGLLKKSTLQAC